LALLANGRPASPRREEETLAMRDPASSPQGSLGSEVAITEHGEVVRVGASGELDLETAPRLDAALTQVEERARAVTIDLRALTFMDSRSTC
jgi:hypothetical protein